MSCIVFPLSETTAWLLASLVSSPSTVQASNGFCWPRRLIFALSPSCVHFIALLTSTPSSMFGRVEADDQSGGIYVDSYGDECGEWCFVADGKRMGVILGKTHRCEPTPLEKCFQGCPIHAANLSFPKGCWIAW